MKRLRIKEGIECLVDDEDYLWMSRLRWKLRPDGYIQLSSYNLLHRLAACAPKGMDVHHRNEDKLDNRKENLEVLPPSEHQRYHFHRIVAFQKSRQKYPDEKQCAVCSKTFTVNRRKRKRNKCCSYECALSLRVLGRKKQAGTA